MKTTVLIGIPCLMVGGTEIQTLRLVQSLVAEGYNCVTVCYFEHAPEMVRQYQEAGSKVVLLSADGNRPKDTLNTYRFLKSGLKRVVSEYRPAIVHVQYMAPGALPIIILKQLRVRTIVATLHTDASIYSNLRLVRLLQRHVVNVFTCVTEIAERSFFGSSQLYYNKVKLKKHNHITIHNCLPPEQEFYNESRKTKEYGNARFTIGVVARLESIKGVDFVMPAFAIVQKRHPDCRLVIVGDGKLKDLMMNQILEYGVDSDAISWYGRVDYTELPRFYRTMDIVWVPSRSEGFGLSAIEAMSQGCPVVASATGGLQEVVKQGVNGILFRTGDIAELADKTIHLLDNIELLESLKEGAVTTANAFRFENYKANILSLYNKLLS